MPPSLPRPPIVGLPLLLLAASAGVSSLAQGAPLETDVACTEVARRSDGPTG